jgi:hypothetical protein
LSAVQGLDMEVGTFNLNIKRSIISLVA